MKVDHIMYAAPSLAEGIASIDSLLKVTASGGGGHPGQGTRNALLSFGNDQYLEIIAPDPDQQLAGTMGAQLERLAQSEVRTFAVATDNFALVRSHAETFGFRTRMQEMSRQLPDGQLLNWQLLFVTGHGFKGCMPFFINWLDSAHPSRNAPVAGNLTRVRALVEDVERYRNFIDALALDVQVESGSGTIMFSLDSSAGDVEV